MEHGVGNVTILVDGDCWEWGEHRVSLHVDIDRPPSPYREPSESGANDGPAVPLGIVGDAQAGGKVISAIGDDILVVPADAQVQGQAIVDPPLVLDEEVGAR